MGLEMSGKKEPDMNISRNSCDLLLLTCINKSKLKSPMIKDFLFIKRGFLTKSARYIKKIINVRTWWSINNTNNYVLLPGITISIKRDSTLLFMLLRSSRIINSKLCDTYSATSPPALFRLLLTIKSYPFGSEF